MKQVIHRKFGQKLLHLSFLFLFFFSVSLGAQDGDPANGKTLFNTNCAACHNLDKKMTGPALRNVETRLADEQGLDRQWLYDWIHNSAAVIKSGDAYANKIYAEYNQAAMTAFPQLSEKDINDILAYTAQEAPAPPQDMAGTGTVNTFPQLTVGLTGTDAKVAFIRESSRRSG